MAQTSALAYQRKKMRKAQVNMLRFLSLFKKASPVRLGRWSHQQTKDTVDLKVDWANHDCCGGPLCTNVPLKAPEKRKDVDEPSDVAMYALGSFHLHTQRP